MEGTEPTTIKPTTIQPSTHVDKEPSHAEIIPITSRQDMNRTALGGFLGVTRPSTDEEDQMDYLVNFFEKHGVTHMSEIMLNIKNIENKLGAVPITLSRLQALYNYIKTQASIESLVMAKQSMEQ